MSDFISLEIKPAASQPEPSPPPISLPPTLQPNVDNGDFEIGTLSACREKEGCREGWEEAATWYAHTPANL